MTIQDLGSIGELLAAIATIATLLYLAVQVRQNTRALKSATFQNITGEMGRNVEPITNSSELANIVIKGSEALEGLSPAERLRFSSVLVASFRRLESVYVQNELGSIDDQMKEGFEISMISLLQRPGGAAWWENAKQTFYPPFTQHVDRRLAADDIPEQHPSMLMDPASRSTL